MESSITHNIDEEYIREWLVLGPFFPDDLDRDFLADVGGEAKIKPREGDTVATAQGETLTWKRYESKEDIVDLLKAVGKHEYATAYAFCVLDSEIEGDAFIYLGSDDSVAVWINGEQVHRFPGDRSIIIDEDLLAARLTAGANNCLVKVSQVTGDWGFAVRVTQTPPGRATLSGVVRDEAGKPVPNLYIHVRQEDSEIEQALTDDQGRYHIVINEATGEYDLYANAFMINRNPVGIVVEPGEVGDQRLGIPLHGGENRIIDFALKRAVSIEGTLLMLDDMTPHAAVPVQAILDGKVFDIALSDDKGGYRFINLKSGRYQIRCQIPGGPVYYVDGEKPSSYESKAATVQVENGKTIQRIDFRFAPFKKGVWRHYGPFDGLAYDMVSRIYTDFDGMMWLATPGGVSRYDGKEFVNLTTKDGLVSPNIRTLHQSPDGVMWFATMGNGVIRYDGEEFVNFTKEKDGLMGDQVISSHCDPRGVMWFGEWGGGVSQYDGGEFVNFEQEEGVPHDTRKIYNYTDGTTWFTKWGSGISRYDGEKFTSFTTPEELREALESKHKLENSASDGLIWARFEDNVCFYDGKEFVNIPLKDSIQGDFVLVSTQRDADRSVWFGLWALSGVGISRYDGKGLVNFAREDGLLCKIVEDIYIDADDVVWLASGTPVDISERGGLSRYDSKGFINFTTRDGLPYNAIKAIGSDINGDMWIGTGDGLSRYDGKEFTTFNTDTEKGLASNQADVIHCDDSGTMWFGVRETWTLDNPRGVSRYDGERFETITQIFGEADVREQASKVWAIHGNQNGVLWFAIQDGGVFRYDGKEFHRFTRDKELENVSIQTLYCASDGVTWFGTEQNGVYSYDEKSGEFARLTREKDGLVDNNISSICGDTKGGIWFATGWNGLSYYNGKEITNFTTDDRLASDIIRSMYCGSDGMMWFGTEHMGVCGYNGAAWTTLDTRDGLASNQVTSIYQDKEGCMWFGTKEGLTRYRPGSSRPKVRFVSVTTDHTYTDFDQIPALRPDTRVTIEYSAIDFKTIPEKRQYRCQVRELDSDWRKPTKSEIFEHIFEEPGTYTFQVQAIDRDLNYSEPASVKLEVIPDPRNHRIIQLEEHIREQELAELERVHQELKDARQIQQSLLPDSPPELEGFAVAGTSIPAREVSGDFYSYLSLGENTGIVLADVTGKSVKAAMVAAMTSGMLNEAINVQNELWNSPSTILSRLNTGLHPHLIRGMFTAMSLGIIQPEQNRLIFSNAGMPYPIVKRGDEVWELEVNGMPLGLIDGAEYDDISIDLEAGDLVIFCSDGVIEAMDESEEMYQTGRLLEVVKEADPGISAQEMVDLIVSDVTEFTGDVELSDDITIVALKCSG